jgi:succinate dehydrogenase/fumarate reductase cytochrome b subunit
LQAISGVVFASFLVLHLATTISAASSTTDYDAVLAFLRPLYRPHVVVEVLMLGIPGIVHIGCAAYSLLWRLRSRRPRSGGRARLHRVAGYVLLLAIVGHVAATRLLPTFGAGPTATGHADFSFLAYSLLNWPWLFVPYYFALGIAGAIHLGLGLGYAARLLLGPRLPASLVSRLSALTATVLAIAVALGVYGMVRGAPDASRARFPEFTTLYERFLPFMHPTERQP